MRDLLRDIAAAFQFLTRLPMVQLSYRADALPRSAKFFPLVGFMLGAAICGIHRVLSPHLPTMAVAFSIVLFSAFITGGMHEDGLADVADAFGGGRNRQQVLEIMKDSRIGTYGALAVVFSVIGRGLLLGYVPSTCFAQYAISAEVLARWTVLPLGVALPAARNESGQGARLAHQISKVSLTVGTILTLAIIIWLLRLEMWKPVVATMVVTLFSGLFYRHRIGGITGDCFGATFQLAVLAVYACGVWQA